jgi:hypothetical protein
MKGEERGNFKVKTNKVEKKEFSSVARTDFYTKRETVN